MPLHESHDNSSSAPVPALPQIADCGAAKVEPAARESICHHPSWKQIAGGKDKCLLCGAIGTELRYLAVDAASAPNLSSSAPAKSSLHWRQSTGLLYVLKDGSNSFEVSVTMAHGSRDMGVRSDFAAKLLQLIEGAQS